MGRVPCCVRYSNGDLPPKNGLVLHVRLARCVSAAWTSVFTFQHCYGADQPRPVIAEQYCSCLCPGLYTLKQKHAWPRRGPSELFTNCLAALLDHLVILQQVVLATNPDPCPEISGLILSLLAFWEMCWLTCKGVGGSKLQQARWLALAVPFLLELLGHYIHRDQRLHKALAVRLSGCTYKLLKAVSATISCLPMTSRACCTLDKYLPMQRWLQQHPQHLAAVQAAVSSPGVSWFLWSFAAAFTGKVAGAVGCKAPADGSPFPADHVALLEYDIRVATIPDPNRQLTRLLSCLFHLHMHLPADQLIRELVDVKRQQILGHAGARITAGSSNSSSSSSASANGTSNSHNGSTSSTTTTTTRSSSSSSGDETKTCSKVGNKTSSTSVASAKSNSGGGCSSRCSSSGGDFHDTRPDAVASRERDRQTQCWKGVSGKGFQAKEVPGEAGGEVPGGAGGEVAGGAGEVAGGEAAGGAAGEVPGGAGGETTRGAGRETGLQPGEAGASGLECGEAEQAERPAAAGAAVTGVSQAGVLCGPFDVAWFFAVLPGQTAAAKQGPSSYTNHTSQTAGPAQYEAATAAAAAGTAPAQGGGTGSASGSTSRKALTTAAAASGEHSQQCPIPAVRLDQLKVLVELVLCTWPAQPNGARYCCWDVLLLLVGLLQQAAPEVRRQLMEQRGVQVLQLLYRALLDDRRFGGPGVKSSHDGPSMCFGGIPLGRASPILEYLVNSSMRNEAEDAVKGPLGVEIENAQFHPCAYQLVMLLLQSLLYEPLSMELVKGGGTDFAGMYITATSKRGIGSVVAS